MRQPSGSGCVTISIAGVMAFRRMRSIRSLDTRTACDVKASAIHQRSAANALLAEGPDDIDSGGLLVTQEHVQRDFFRPRSGRTRDWSRSQMSVELGRNKAKLAHL